MHYEKNEDSDQPVHPRSLIKVFSVRRCVLQYQSDFIGG